VCEHVLLPGQILLPLALPLVEPSGVDHCRWAQISFRQTFSYGFVIRILLGQFAFPNELVDLGPILSFPGRMIAGVEGLVVIDLDLQLEAGGRLRVVLQAAIGLAPTGQNEHHGPISLAKDAGKRLFIGAARIRALAGVRMDPKSPKLRWMKTIVDLLVKELRHRQIVELHAGVRAGLSHQANIGYQQRILSACDPEAADLRVSQVTQRKELGPGRRREPQAGI